MVPVAFALGGSCIGILMTGTDSLEFTSVFGLRKCGGQCGFEVGCPGNAVVGHFAARNTEFTCQSLESWQTWNLDR